MPRDENEKGPPGRDEPQPEGREGTPEPSDLISGAINIMGLRIDLGELLASPEGLKDSLGQLRESLKAAGGKEALSDQEWQSGRASVTGHIRTRGLLGEQEFHIGATGQSGRRSARDTAPEPPEVMEPPVDVFDEGSQVIIVADVPGVTLEDLELKVTEASFSLTTRDTAHRSYRKELSLDFDLEPDRLEATCHNGVLEVRLLKVDRKRD